MTIFLVAAIVLTFTGGIVYSTYQAAKEAEQARELAGRTYQIYHTGSTGLVAEFNTDWEAEAYVDEHGLGTGLYISYPEDRFKACLKALRQQ